MLDSLRGVLLESDEDYAVLDVGGLRFRAEIPASTAATLPAVGEATTVLTRLSFNPNDGVFNLFGFATAMERDCYDVLIGMSGIGPRKALMILSHIEVGAFAQAIVRGDLGYLSRIKGIGKKTAERLLVELREKMVAFADAAPGPKNAAVVSMRENVSDAVQALLALGTRPAVAEKAIRSAVEVLGEDAPTESLVREGLRHR
jgi:Holliday junction DNA helicase RuvA